jgi:pectate lyase
LLINPVSGTFTSITNWLNKRGIFMQIRYGNILLMILFVSANASGQGAPTGWASLNGGTCGGKGGDTIAVTTRAELCQVLDAEIPTIIMINDTIDLVSGELLKVTASNITIMGSGRQAMIRNGGLMIFGDNVIIRNLSIGDSYIDGHWDGKGNPGTDCLTLYGRNIWVDHCELFHSFDGLLDISGTNGIAADNITISWTRFRDHNKVMLVGSNDRQTYGRGHFKVTIHHCWFDGLSTFYDAEDNRYYRLNQRHPRVRFGDVHVFNNYYEQIASYCIAARLESDVVVENNYFRNLKDPHIIEDRDKGMDDPELLARDNIYENVRGRMETSGDAFDPSASYVYSLHKTENVPTIVLNGAGKPNREYNQGPLAINDTINWSRKDEMVIYPLENDTDADADPLRISRIINKPAGRVVTGADHLTYYIPDSPPKSDEIIYEIIDFQGGVSNASIVMNFK